MPDRVFCDQHDPKHCAKWANASRPLFDDICPHCEIDRLKAELEDAKDEAFKREARIMMYVNKNSDIKRQLDASQALLAEARTEVERLSLENRQMLQGMKWDNQLKSEARQEAARECLLLFYLALDESISFEETYIKGVKSIKAKFGLEG